MRHLRAVLLCGLVGAACSRADETKSQPEALPAVEQQAARETEIAGLRLLDAASLGPRLAGFGIRLGYVENDANPGGGRYTCGAMTASESQSAGRTIAQALSLLPDASLKQLELRYVILCSQATASGRRIGGIPVPPLKLLMLDVGAAGASEAHLQHVFFHELYHLIEFSFNAYEDAEWQKQFGGGGGGGGGYTGAYPSGSDQTEIGRGKRGFVNRYAESFPQEDRAELFAASLLEPEKLVDRIRATDDEVLRDKALYVARKCERLTGLQIALPGF